MNIRALKFKILLVVLLLGGLNQCILAHGFSTEDFSGLIFSGGYVSTDEGESGLFIGGTGVYMAIFNFEIEKLKIAEKQATSTYFGMGFFETVMFQIGNGDLGFSRKVTLNLGENVFNYLISDGYEFSLRETAKLTERFLLKISQESFSENSEFNNLSIGLSYIF